MVNHLPIKTASLSVGGRECQARLLWLSSIVSRTLSIIAVNSIKFDENFSRSYLTNRVIVVEDFLVRKTRNFEPETLKLKLPYQS